MGRHSKFFNIKESFLSHVIKDEKSGCWLWEPKVFRYRVNFGYETIVLNPRRYCAYISGYNIPVGKHVINACCNDNCVNPKHTILKHDRTPLNQTTPLYLDFDDLKFGSNAARNYYGKTIDEMRQAREITIQLFRRIKKEPIKMDAERIANKYGIGINYAQRVLDMSYEEFKSYLVDIYDNGETPLDEMGDALREDANLY